MGWVRSGAVGRLEKRASRRGATGRSSGRSSVLRGVLVTFMLGHLPLLLASTTRNTSADPVQVHSAERGIPPDTVDAPLANARNLIEQGKLAEAEADLRAYLAGHEDSAIAHVLLGLVMYQQDKPVESLQEFTRAAKLRPPRSSDLVIVALDYVKLSDLTSADRWISLAVKQNPDSAGAWRYLGGIKYSENRFTEALDAYRHCLQLQPRDVLSEDGIGRSFEGSGRQEDAAAAYRQAIDWALHAGREIEQPFLHLGVLLLHQGKAADALSYLHHAEHLAPSDADVHRALGEGDMQLKKWPDAQEELEKAVAISPRDSHLHWLLAAVYRSEGMVEKEHAEEQLFTSLVGSHSNDRVP